MGNGFRVDPNTLMEAAAALDSLSEQLKGTADVVRSVSLDFNPSAFGLLVGQLIALPVRDILGIGVYKLSDSASSISDGADVVRQAAREYQDIDVFPDH